VERAHGYRRHDDCRPCGATVNNVFDRVYYETIGSPYNGNWYGEPRNVLLRIDGRL
jgi:outer membrane receptor for ferric coprogen and ferric-rhodotorulic acid